MTWGWLSIIKCTSSNHSFYNSLYSVGASVAEHGQGEDDDSGQGRDGCRLSVRRDALRRRRGATAAQGAPGAQVLLRVRVLPRGDRLPKTHL